MEDTAARSGIDAAVSELNGREGLVWGQVKTTLTSYNRYTGDSVVWGLMKNDKTKSYPYLGESYEWAVLPTETGGTLVFSGSGFTLPLSKSTISVPGHWRRVP